MELTIQKIAAFADGDKGGNPAGVVLADQLPKEETMQETAKQVGFSETVFAAPFKDGWRVRYFSPENEVPFCGHATIALGAALSNANGPAEYKLMLNDGDISVRGGLDGDPLAAELLSLPTRQDPADPKLVARALALFGYGDEDLDPSLPVMKIHAGADHLILALADRKKLADMQYDLKAGRDLMLEFGLVTIMLVFQSAKTSFDVRNAFASGGVVEDPATGAAAAAFSGYVRDQNLLNLDWSMSQSLSLSQGDDMGAPSRLTTVISPEQHSPVRVSGRVRMMEA